MINRFRFFTYY